MFCDALGLRHPNVLHIDRLFVFVFVFCLVGPCCTHIHTYIPTYLPTYIPTYLPTYLHTYIPTYIPTYLPTYLHTYCPRSFEQEMWLTRHTRHDHQLERPFICSFCSGYWPGRDSLRLHIAADHRYEEHDFPMECPLCIRDAGNSKRFLECSSF